MTTTTSSNDLNNFSPEDTASQLGAFLKEHGEIETILPVALGLFVTSRFQLRGANALLVNLLVASLVRQIFFQLKQQTPQLVAESNTSNVNNDINTEDTIGEPNFQGYAISHAVPGRVRLRMPQLALDAGFAHRLEQALNADEYVRKVRINRAAASIAINYNNQGLSDWELGMRLMGIINSIQEENPVSQAIS
ncbi:HMA2 domain-containing protein [Oscillatoria salina]|uniref:HMA2 domain-containing protein n=1 Tax=Oscillatoria salina TaxID=331517 RepID=UPI0013B5F621|nr:metal ABC transporter ATPase [Oscillatoria salina]MBZ8182889.1 metal ABC transporter ATPase [Oscillatoria salina IIICB1]NET88930.1 metal ABC transporter ATPase [Kamptonema sp. SIO1D9]